jgi:hypothetical protein
VRTPLRSRKAVDVRRKEVEMPGSSPDRSAKPREDHTNGQRPVYIAALMRHFIDLRDGTHGDAASQRDKERLFMAAVALLDPYVRQVLNEINAYLVLDTGEVSATGVRCCQGGLEAVWALS